jgi:RNA polymerase sigma factor (sigma-70 family)
VTPKDIEAFADVYEREVWHVFGFLGYRLGSREQAEDLTQQTFERALAAWDRFDERRASARTWLLAIARNLLIDHYRRAGAVQHEPLSEQDLSLYTAETVSIELSAELQAAVARLGDRERELIALRYGGDLTGPEIAEITGLSLANVQQILSRSLRRLRDELEGEGEADAAGGRP